MQLERHGEQRHPLTTPRSAPAVPGVLPADAPAAAGPGVRPRDRAVSAYAELSAQVRAAGLLGRRRGYYWVRFAAVTAAVAGLAVVSLLIGNSWWQLALAPCLAMVFTQFAFLGHDAAHQQVFASARNNEIAARLLAALATGLSYGWWMRKHTRHHGAPNQLGKDGDIESTVLAFHPEAARSRRGLRAWLARRQGWFFFPLLLLEGAHLHVAGVTTLLRRGSVKRRFLDLGLILVHWVAYLAFLAAVMSPGKAVAFVAVQVGLFGLFMGGAFAPNHVGMPIVERDVKIDFLRRQVLMSRNITGGIGIDFVMGGLNRQVEHHLFPSMPRPNLRLVQPMVRDFCAQHGIAYTETSLFDSYRAIVRYLNDVGLGGRDVFSCPLAAQLRT